MFQQLLVIFVNLNFVMEGLRLRPLSVSLCQFPFILPTSHTSYLCQNLSVFTFLLHVSKPRRPGTPSQIFSPAHDTERSRSQPLQYIWLLITLERMSSVSSSWPALILVFIVALSPRNPPPHQGPGEEILPIILTVVGVEEPFKWIAQQIC